MTQRIERLLTLRISCDVCGREDSFHRRDEAGAQIAAQALGWRIDGDRDLCPEHAGYSAQDAAGQT